jgi:hypothetical protein
MHAKAPLDSQLDDMLAIVLINNSTLDPSTLASAKLKLIRAAEVHALEQNKTVSESSFNQSRRRSETMKPIIVKIQTVSKFFENSLNAVRSLTRQNSLPRSDKRVVEIFFDKTSAKLKEADKESLICHEALMMLFGQDYPPRIRFRLDDAVTVLETIEHVDNQRLGSFFSVRFGECCQFQSGNTRGSIYSADANDKRTAAQVEDAKSTKKQKFRLHR